MLVRDIRRSSSRIDGPPRVLHRRASRVSISPLSSDLCPSRVCRRDDTATRRRLSDSPAPKSAHASDISSSSSSYSRRIVVRSEYGQVHDCRETTGKDARLSSSGCGEFGANQEFTEDSNAVVIPTEFRERIPPRRNRAISPIS